MRILMLAQFYPPIIGGEERHVRNLSIDLVARGHNVAVATLWHEGMPEFEVDQGVRVHRVRGTMQRMSVLFSEKSRPYAPPFPDPEILWGLRHVIKQERPDIIHAHNWIVHSFTPLKAWSKAKLVMTLHDYSFCCVQTRLMYHGAICQGPDLRKCLQCASEFYGAAKGAAILLANQIGGKVECQTVDMFLPVSEAVAEGTQLKRLGVPYQVIPNFVPDNVSELRDDTHPLLEHLPKGDYLLFVGDMTRDKGVEVLLQAHAEMEKHIPLVMIGRPGNDFSASLPANVLHFPGWPHSAVMSAWSRCTIGVTPSIWHDPCPTVAMEAMAAGRPIIASRIGGLADIVKDGESGLLVAPGNAQALREAIQSLLDDPPRRERMATLAKQRVAIFQAKTVVPRIEQVYQEVVQS
jgi:glycosyltransferase involved in cell wall biosynthesis